MPSCRCYSLHGSGNLGISRVALPRIESILGLGQSRPLSGLCAHVFFSYLAVTLNMEIRSVALLYHEGVARGVVDWCDVVKHQALITHM